MEERDAALDLTVRLVNACEAGDEPTVRAVLQAGANVDGSERFGLRPGGALPLTLAVRNGHAGIVKTLLLHQAAVLVGSGANYAGTVETAAQSGRLRVASLLLTHIHTNPVAVRTLSVNSVGARRKCAAGELTRSQIATLLHGKHCTGELARSVLAMLVADGHLQEVEPTGWSGLANRLAGQPSKWLAAQLTHARDATHASRRRAMEEEPVGTSAQIDLCLALGARPRWTTRKHHVFEPGFRARVKALLLCAQRHADEAEAGEGVGLGKLPREVLMILIEWLAEVTYWDYEDRAGQELGATPGSQEAVA